MQFCTFVLPEIVFRSLFRTLNVKQESQTSSFGKVSAVIFPKVNSDSEFSQQKVSSELKKSHKFCLKVAAVILRTTFRGLAMAGKSKPKLSTKIQFLIEAQNVNFRRSARYCQTLVI